jgi:hypothetical protein
LDRRTFILLDQRALPLQVPHNGWARHCSSSAHIIARIRIAAWRVFVVGGDQLDIVVRSHEQTCGHVPSLQVGFFTFVT